MLPAGAPLDPILALDASSLSAAVEARRLSCAEVMRAHLAQIERLNPAFNAVVSLRDPGALLAEARAADAELAAGRRRGWLHGLPIAIKDLAATAGLRTTLGSPIFTEQVPDADCLTVTRIRRAGAIVIGKTNTPEFGLGSQTYNPVFGATRNAWDPAMCAGGSSGGAAVALALRMLPVADGSDMMGSLRNPAAFNNVLGLRPSFGRVPNLPQPELYLHQLATEGPMARSVADLARLLATLAGADPRAPLSLPDAPEGFADGLDRDIAGVRVGWIGDWDGHYPLEAGILPLCAAALAVFEGLGATVEPVLPDFPPDRLWAAWLVLRGWAVAALLGPLHADAARRARMKPEAVWEVENGLALSAMGVHRASVARSDWHRCLLGHFERFDALALPTAQVFPFDVGLPWPRVVAGREMQTYHQWMEIVIPGSLSVCPVVNLPAGFGSRGLPMGLQLIGRPRGERRLLEIARAYERASDWLGRLPPALA